jgi:hypothetical protein
MRSCKRVDSRIPVLIEWSDGSERYTEQGFTTDVGRQGCLIVAPRDISLDLRVRLTNQATHQSADATIVWKEQNANQGWELGVELLNPPRDFWGAKI